MLELIILLIQDILRLCYFQNFITRMYHNLCQRNLILGLQTKKRLLLGHPFLLMLKGQSQFGILKQQQDLPCLLDMVILMQLYPLRCPPHRQRQKLLGKLWHHMTILSFFHKEILFLLQFQYSILANYNQSKAILLDRRFMVLIQAT